jgi:hypothetical protein
MTKPLTLLTETISRDKKLRYLRQTRKYLIVTCYVFVCNTQNHIPLINRPEIVEIFKGG